MFTPGQIWPTTKQNTRFWHLPGTLTSNAEGQIGRNPKYSVVDGAHDQVTLASWPCPPPVNSQKKPTDPYDIWIVRLEFYTLILFIINLLKLI